MDSEDTPPSTSRVQCCDCECTCSTINRSYSGTLLRTLKRKFPEFEVEKGGFDIPGLDISQVAKVELGNECIMLREMVTSQQKALHDLSVELEKERNASSSSANEAMSMILRLQREKADVQMELRQFKRFAEEKIAHDGGEFLALEDLLYKREQVIESLTYEMQACKHRMMNYDLTEVEAEGEIGVMDRNSSIDKWEAQCDIPTYDYPPIKCSSYENQLSYEVNNDAVDAEKHVFGEPPQSRDQLKDLEYQIDQFEQSHPDMELFSTKNVFDKVIIGHSPRQYRHVRISSNDTSSSILATVKETSTDVGYDPGSAKKKECVHIQLEDYSNLRKVGDNTSDRVYTVDSVQHGGPYNSVTEPKASAGVCEDYITTQKEPLYRGDLGDPDVKKLYTRLQSLEADRESMRQALISMGTEKAQLVLLKEIAQQLCQDMSQVRTLPVRKTSVSGSFSILSLFKWIVSFVFWRKKARQSRYMFGMSASNIGLLTLLDKGPPGRQWRSISSIKV